MPGRERTWRWVTVLAALLVITACGTVTRRAPVEGRQTLVVEVPEEGHQVRAGDTLYGIAFRYGLDYRAVAAWNGIDPPFRIYAGQRLRLTRPADPVASRPLPRATGLPAPSLAAKPPGVGEGSSPPPPAAGAKRAGLPQPTYQADGDVGEQRLVWVWPANGRITRRFSQRGNKGVDIGGKSGAPVRAAAAGRVVYSGSGLVGYGKLIILKHNNAYLSAYAHNDRLLVKEGESVASGQRIAHMGQTGAQEVKLHFEIRRDGKPVDPLKYLPRQGPREEDADA